MSRKRRIWFYGRGWQPRWWELVFFGADEYGRRTIVLAIPHLCAIVWAYRTCRCSDCDDVREQTARFEAEALAEEAYL